MSFVLVSSTILNLICTAEFVGYAFRVQKAIFKNSHMTLSMIAFAADQPSYNANAETMPTGEDDLISIQPSNTSFPKKKTTWIEQ